MTRLDPAFSLSKRDEPLGLLCSPDGLSLAGAPLLRRGVAGFVARPGGELASLMKAAYGAAHRASDMAAGLRIVAEALNHDDLARAMVAAVRLRLPPLDWSAAERIARAEAALAKYNSDEPRNEQGRWTSGGGGETATPGTAPAASDGGGDTAADSGVESGDLGAMAFGANPFGVSATPNQTDAKGAAIPRQPRQRLALCGGPQDGRADA